MFFRKELKQSVNIFDISNMNTERKKDIVDQVASIIERSIASLSKDSKESPFIVLPIRIPLTQYYNSTIRSLLFQDLLGEYRESYRKTFENSAIINTRKDQVKEKKRIRRGITKKEYDYEEVNNTKITAEDSNTKQLLKEKYSKTVRKICLSLLNEDNPFSGETNIEDLHQLLKINKIITVDMTYCFSELPVVMSQIKEIIRLNQLQNWSILKQLKIIQKTNIQNLYQRNNIKKKETWENLNDSLLLSNDPVIDYVYNQLQKKTLYGKESIETKFIPVSYIIFLEDDNLFKDNNSIVVEEREIRNPAFFVEHYKTSYTLGSPEFDSDTNKGQSKIAVNLQNHSLKTTMTFIPSGFSQRLLKSKLKSIGIPNLTTNNDEFIFFSEDFVKQLSSSNQKDLEFLIEIDGKINMFYYTQLIQSFLKNKFAGTYYGSSDCFSLKLYFPIFFSDMHKDIRFLYNKLESKQESIRRTFNKDNVILITEDMFSYEKVALLYYYLIDRIDFHNNKIPKSGINVDINSNIIKHKGDFRSIQNGKYSTEFETFPQQTAYIQQCLFKLVTANNTEQILGIIDRIVENVKTTIEKEISTPIHTKLIRDIANLYIMEEHNERLDYNRNCFIRKFSSCTISYTVEFTKCKVLCDTNPIETIENSLVFLYKVNYYTAVQRTISLFDRFLVHWINTSLDKVLPNFLTNEVIQKRVIEESTRWSSNTSTQRVNFISKTLKENTKNKTPLITVQDFLLHLVKEYTSYIKM